MRKVFVVFVKDTVYTVPGGLAQWHYTGTDAGELKEVILGSGSLAVFKPDDENGTPNEHLGGARTNRIAFFPAGGWSGYAWEEIDDQAMAVAAAQRSGIAVPRAG